MNRNREKITKENFFDFIFRFYKLFFFSENLKFLLIFINNNNYLNK